MNRRTRILSRVLPAVLWLLVIASYAQAQYWDWSPAGQPHHKAVVIVRGPDGSTGSGCYVRFADDTVGVLTCAHALTGGEATVTFQDGRTLKGGATVDRFKFDVGWVFVENPNIKPVEFSGRQPAVGERVEYVTFGGPKQTLRHFYATVTAATDQRLETDGKVTYGDSGGAIFNQAGEVVGVQSVGLGDALDSQTAGGATFDIFDGSGSAGYTSIRDFLGRVRAGGCVGGNCYQPRYQAPQRQGPINFYPPQQQPQQQPSQPAAPLAPVSGGDAELSAKVDRLSGQVAALASAIAKIEGKPGPQGERGPAGTQGPKGEPGKDCDCDTEAIVAAVLARLPKTPEIPDHETHVVIVADQSAEYWPRLSDDIERAKQYYSGIRMAGKPDMAVQLPQIVVYRDGTPVHQIKGLRSVSQALSEVARGGKVF